MQSYSMFSFFSPSPYSTISLPFSSSPQWFVFSFLRARKQLPVSFMSLSLSSVIFPSFFAFYAATSGSINSVLNDCNLLNHHALDIYFISRATFFLFRIRQKFKASNVDREYNLLFLNAEHNIKSFCLNILRSQ